MSSDSIPLFTVPINKVPTLVLRRTVEPWGLAVSVAAVKDHLNMTSAIKDADIEQKIKVATAAIESVLSIALMEQTWVEAWDAVPRVVEIQVGPLLSLTSIKVIDNFDTDSETVVNSTLYVVDVDAVCARTTWPTHRGWRSFKITHTAGFKAKGAADAAALLAAQAAIPLDLQHAVTSLAAYLYENREGQGFEPQFVALAARGVLPPMVTQFITPYIKWGV